MKDRVDISRDTLQVWGAFKPFHLRDCLSLLNAKRKQRGGQVVLDFRNCTKAYPNSMVPLVSYVDELIRRGHEIELILPKADQARRLFLHTNWAHYLCPGKYDMSDDYSIRHVAARRYCNDEEHTSILSYCVDVVMRMIDVKRSALSLLGWSMSEVMDNVLNHSNSSGGGFVQLAVYSQNQRLAFCVADSGRGILSSLRESRPSLQSDRVAIEEAVRTGVTRNIDCGMGNGLSGTLQIACDMGGRLRIVSGSADVEWVSGQNPQSWANDRGHSFFGTVVDFQMPSSAAGDLSEVLSKATGIANYVAIDYLERGYLSEDGKTIELMMRDETSGFGSRHAGAQIRRKILHLLGADPLIRVAINWDGVQVISSSYVDEYLGKLFLELGPLKFISAVVITNATAEVQGFINRGILQRVRRGTTADELESVDGDER